MQTVRESDHYALESNRVIDNEMYKLTTFRLNNSASFTLILNFLFQSLFKTTFEGF